METLDGKHLNKGERSFSIESEEKIHCDYKITLTFPILTPARHNYTNV